MTGSTQPGESLVNCEGSFLRFLTTETSGGVVPEIQLIFSSNLATKLREGDLGKNVHSKLDFNRFGA
jgi:hypothetical protein